MGNDVVVFVVVVPFDCWTKHKLEFAVGVDDDDDDVFVLIKWPLMLLPVAGLTA